ncbi:translation initiation factor IF-2-like [Pyrgilauda ruficollis]|uniref:translation initiation factor IF-2-like n=1 Tax=Pyrgilauda ruficollis TaxID=221976 RepID=UPI001B86845A|nr:translation initiation factor IF-2-like [Pyrgilauda ruficollis]XP_041330356.1 translation initiation factor IF-2-like [Pyrgilauda ruficollis]XP_041330357.1 translation initiation factor IF-2-like [Pyrgilauda ruficollis]
MAAPPAAAAAAAAFSSPRLPAAASGERPQAVLGSRPAGRWRCRERQPSRAAGVCEEGASRGEPGWAARPRCGLTPPPARTEPAPPAPGAGGAAGTPVRRRHLAAEAAPAEPAAARGAGGSGRSAGNAPSGGAGSGGCRSASLGRPPRCGGARPRRAEWGAAAVRRSSSGRARPPPPAGGSGSRRQRLPGSRAGALRAAGRPRGLPEPFRVGQGRKVAFARFIFTGSLAAFPLGFAGGFSSSLRRPPAPPSCGWHITVPAPSPLSSLWSL